MDKERGHRLPSDKKMLDFLQRKCSIKTKDGYGIKASVCWYPALVPSLRHAIAGLMEEDGKNKRTKK